MDNKKIKKGASMGGVMMAMLLCIGFVLGGFIYFSEQMTQSNKVVDTKYEDFYDRMDDTQYAIDARTKKIQENAVAMKESDNQLIAAWNGLKGLGSTLLLFAIVPDQGYEMVVAGFNVMDQIPDWIKTIAGIIILTFLVIIVLKVIKGEPGGID